MFARARHLPLRLSWSRRGRSSMPLVMSVLYPARMVHMALLFPTAILATRMQNPTVDDLAHAYRLIGFLKTQVDSGFVMKGSPSWKLRVYVDASRRGNGCLIACMDDSPIAWRSHKIPHAALWVHRERDFDGVTYVIWIADMFCEVGHAIDDAAAILRDNMSAVIIMETGGSFKKTKHILTRFMFIR